MKLAELKSVTEHNTSPHPDQDVLPYEKQVELLNDSTRTNITASSPEGPILSVFKNVQGSNHHILIFTDRHDQKVPVGYATLVKQTKYWDVQDMWIKKEYRGKGLITNLYNGFKNLNYSIISGDLLSIDAENVWKSLGKNGLAKTLDTKTGEMLPFDLSPIGDGNLMNGIKPQYYWVAEGEPHESVFSKYSRPLAEEIEARKYYLEGVRTNFKTINDPEFKVVGMVTYIIDAEI